MRLVAGHDRHEAIGRILRRADAIPVFAAAPGLVDQLADRDRGSARLAGQPFPVPWQQCDFAGHHAEPRPARSSACRRLRLEIVRGGPDVADRQASQHLIEVAAQIKFDRFAGGAIEDEDRGIVAPLQYFLGRAGDLAQITSGNAPVGLESHIGWDRRRIHGNILCVLRQYYPDKSPGSIKSG